MGYIVIDVETSGKYIYKYPKDHPTMAGLPYPADAPDQPRVAEVAIIHCDDDFNIEREYQSYIQPDGWEMQPDATAINGLTTEFLIQHGAPMQLSLNVYHAAIRQHRVVVAFNAQFDCKALRGEARHCGVDDLFDETYNICAMRSAMKLSPRVVKLIREGEEKVRGGYPTLADVVAHFRLPPYKKHSALDDARATALVARELNAAGALLAPDVHRAKNHTNGDVARDLARLADDGNKELVS